jgi:hypothetical protein
MAARIALVHALRTQTSAGDRVFDSPLEPVDILLAPDAPALPLIAVYCGDTENEPEGLDITGATVNVEFTLQIYVPLRVAIKENDVQLELKAAGLAMAIDIVQRQMESALLVSDTAWSKLFRKICFGLQKVTTRPYLVQMEEGVRCALREVTFDALICPPPAWGSPLTGAYADLDAALRATPENAPIADLIEQLVEQPAGIPEWRKIQASLGATFETIKALGLTPPDAIEAETPPPLNNVTVETNLEVSSPFNFETETLRLKA